MGKIKGWTKRSEDVWITDNVFISRNSMFESGKLKLRIERKPDDYPIPYVASLQDSHNQVIQSAGADTRKEANEWAMIVMKRNVIDKMGNLS